MFKDLKLEASYYTGENDIAQEFYIPVLSNSVSYDRVSAYFNSKALAQYSEGIEGLVDNKGKMRLIISHEISKEDFEQIKLGYKVRDTIEDELLNKLYEPTNLEEKRKLNNLAHLIAEGHADVKIGFTYSGIFHTKFGICKDKNKDIVYFVGSNNETEAAINKNYESFDITVSWNCDSFHIQKPLKAIKRFEDLWEGKNNNFVFALDFNEVLKKELIKFNKGSLLLNTDILTEDALILTYQNSRLLLRDNLKSYTIKGTEPAITQRLFPYLQVGYPNFRDDLNHIDMQKIIGILEKFANRKKFDFIVSEELKRYISSQSYFINERAKYGFSLKYYEEDLAPQILERFEKFKEVAIKYLIREPREVQLWCAFYMYEMQRGSNFSVPGAGKTMMKYITFSYLNSEEVNKVDKIVMIGPKNSFLAWKNEFTLNFGTNKELKVVDVQQQQYNTLEFVLACRDANLILVNYESVGKYLEGLRRIIDEKTMLILDEVHRIKGINSSRANLVLEISKKPIYKYALTGTPIPNSYEDIYNMLQILYGQEYNQFFNFRKDELKSPPPRLVEKINDSLYPFYWRTTKEQLMVPKANEDIFLKSTATEEEQNLINMLFRKFGKSAFELYIRLMQASSNPKLLLNTVDFIEMYGEDLQDSIGFDYEGQFSGQIYSQDEIALIKRIDKTSKYKLALSQVIELGSEDKQCIVWCMFVDTINSVKSDLISKGINAEAIYGATSQSERDEIIARFIRGEIDVLVTNPHTLGESVSLHHTCHDAIYLEYSFNLTHLLQSKDRIHRLGLSENQYTQYYFCMLEGNPGQRNTIDERIYNRLMEKEQIMKEAIERGVLQPDPTIDLNEILSLFNDSI